MQKDDIEIANAHRLFMYSLMGRIFAEEPTEELLKLIQSSHTNEELSLISNIEKEKNIFIVLAKDCELLKLTYTKLFIGPFSLLAPPWESVYCSNDRTLFQKNTLEIRNIYRKFGLLPVGYPKVADDHISIEFSFMANLAKRLDLCIFDKTSEDRKKIIEASINFLKQHLLIWIPKFLQDLPNTSEQDLFYKSAAIISNKFIQSDFIFLSSLE